MLAWEFLMKKTMSKLAVHKTNLKKAKVSGFRKRMKSSSGKQIVKRRRKKKRVKLAA